MSKIWLVYCVPGMQMYLLSTGQILQFGLKVEGDKSGSTFYNKSSDAVLSATSNLWDNIQIIRTCILKYNVSNLVSFVTRHLNFETLYYCFGHASNEVMHHILHNVKDAKKIYFPTQKYVCFTTLLLYAKSLFSKCGQILLFIL